MMRTITVRGVGNVSARPDYITIIRKRQQTAGFLSFQGVELCRRLEEILIMKELAKQFIGEECIHLFADEKEIQKQEAADLFPWSAFIPHWDQNALLRLAVD